MEPVAEGPPQDPDRLNGWKEIASFLGKGVRTAQRWERDLDLPVHRLGREGGEIVVAFKSELTEWTLAQDAARRGEAPASTSSLKTPDEGADRGVRGLSPVRLPAAAAVAFFILAAAVAAWVFTGTAAPVGQPASWRVSGDTLEVFDAGGSRLWSHAFPARLVPDASQPGDYGDASGGLVAVADIDGDRDREVLFGLKPADLRGSVQGFHVFNSDGSVRFAFEPTPEVRFGATIYRPPWLFRRIFLTTGPGGKTSLWVVFVHGLEFPTLLVELSPEGDVLAEYWSNGYIDSLAEATWRGHPAIIVGGTNNETQGASLAVFPRNQVTGTAPALNPVYRCADCRVGGGPAEFFLFPLKCIGRNVGGQATVAEIWADNASRLHASVQEWSGLGPPHERAAEVWYWLGPDLAPERAELGGSYLQAHGLLEAKGLLDHPFGPADEAGMFPVRRWNGSSFVDLPPAPVTR